MSKHIDLIKKLKALAERGVGGEAVNAQNLLEKLLLKHNLRIEDIEGDAINEYFFKINPNHDLIFTQIVGKVNSEIKLYETLGPLTKKGNTMIRCTAAEYVEIEQMHHIYTKLYDEEIKVFYRAFCTANDLLIEPPEKHKRGIDDLSEKERDDYYRAMHMAEKIKTENIKKQLNR